MNLSKLFKKPITEPLPAFEPIPLGLIPAASTLLFYGGNKLTELVGNRLYGHPYAPPAFHAAFYINDGLFLNVGKFKEVMKLDGEFRSTRRIDVIVYKNLDSGARKQLCKHALLDTSRPKIGLSLPDYSWSDYLRFGLKFLKPSKKDFCSENCVELFNLVGHKVSDLEPYNTAPWDLLEFALAHPESCSIHTLWIGPDFR